MTAVGSEIEHADGRIELASDDDVTHSPLYNHDLAPVRVAQRTWTTWSKIFTLFLFKLIIAALSQQEFVYHLPA